MAGPRNKNIKNVAPNTLLIAIFPSLFFFAVRKLAKASGALSDSCHSQTHDTLLTFMRQPTSPPTRSQEHEDKSQRRQHVNEPNIRSRSAQLWGRRIAGTVLRKQQEMGFVTTVI